MFDGLALFRLYQREKTPRGVHNMLRVRVCAAHIGGFLAQISLHKGHLFRQIFFEHGCVCRNWQKSVKNWFVCQNLS